MTPDLREMEATYRSLVDRYSDAINQGDWKAAASVFAEDGEWAVGEPFNFGAVGPAAIEELIGERIGDYDFIMQMVGPLVLTEAGDNRARGRVTIAEQGRQSAPGGIHLFGWYEDDIALQDGTWCFTRRVFKVLALDDLSPVVHTVFRH